MTGTPYFNKCPYITNEMDHFVKFIQIITKYMHEKLCQTFSTANEDLNDECNCA